MHIHPNLRNQTRIFEGARGSAAPRGRAPAPHPWYPDGIPMSQGAGRAVPFGLRGRHLRHEPPAGSLAGGISPSCSRRGASSAAWVPATKTSAADVTPEYRSVRPLLRETLLVP